MSVCMCGHLHPSYLRERGYRPNCAVGACNRYQPDDAGRRPARAIDDSTKTASATGTPPAGRPDTVPSVESDTTAGGGGQGDTTRALRIEECDAALAVFEVRAQELVRDLVALRRAFDALRSPA